MFRRFAALVAALALAFSLAPTALAYQAAPVASGTLGAFNMQNCPVVATDHYWTGPTNSSPPPNNSRTAIQAFFRPSTTGFDSCTYIQWVYTWTSWWIALVPRTGGTANTILQIGLIKCKPGVGMPAFCDTVPHYVWAKGGCQGYEPTWRDLGRADWNRHPYVIYEFWNNQYNSLAYMLQVNGGASGWNGYAGKYATVIVNTDPAVSCWLDKTSGNYTGNRADWHTEKVVTQDSIGDSNNVSVMDTAAFKVMNGGWQYPGWSSGYNCSPGTSDPHDHCVYTGSSSALFYTAQ